MVNNELNDLNFTTEKLRKLSKEKLIDKYLNLLNKKTLQEDFILNISHDLRSPLNVILSILQCYKYSIDNPEKTEEYLDSIKRNGYKILKLVNNLIDSTKLERDHYDLNKQNVEIISLIEWNISNIDKYARQKNISLVFDTNVEECVMAVDIEAIDRIIVNLISNAVKFSPKGSCIYINVLKSDNNITMSVKDQGMGIPIEEQKDIFNRFVQSSKNNKTEHTGSGIGLDLVKRLVQAHNGTIKLESKENCGSEFRVKLPVTVLDVNNVDKKKNNYLHVQNKVEVLEVEFSDIYL
ncbi:MAG: HAMP domain-containing histidine kinase [Clostridium butyricum]|nr:HAMP domain-containing histidine kinase [Clostridium butyricum]